MRIWIKYLIASVLGVLLALVLPPNDGAVENTLSFLFELSLRIGRYLIIPLAFFSLAIAVFELNAERKFWKSLGKTFVLMIVSTIVACLIGILVAALVKPQRIPISVTSAPLDNLAQVTGIKDFLFSIFPSNPIEILASASLLLPTAFLAALIGFAFSHDRTTSQGAIQLFDVVSRISYQLNMIFVEFISILMIIIAAKTGYAFKSLPKIDVYLPLLSMVGYEVLASTLILVPLLIWQIGKKRNPFASLFALLAPSLASFFSGDSYFAASALIRHAKDSLGIRRRSGALNVVAALIFGRVGTALVTSTTFVVILSSYSNIGITPLSLFLILALAVPATIVATAAPGFGTLAALPTLCMFYGRGFENSFLIALPIAIPLVAMAAFLDILWAGAASFILAQRAGLVEEKEVRFYI